MKKYFILLVACFIVGCKADMEVTVNTDQIIADKHTLQEAILLVEVAACDNFEDSRKESKSLINARKEILYIFANSQYMQCYNKKFKSFAEFKVPVSIGKIPSSEKNIPQTEIYVFSNETTLLSVFITDDLKSKIENAKESPLISNLKLDLSFNIVAGDKKLDELYILPSYGSSTYQPIGSLVKVTNLKEIKNPKIKLSDVATDALLKFGVVHVIVYRNFLEELLK